LKSFGKLPLGFEPPAPEPAHATGCFYGCIVTRIIGEPSADSQQGDRTGASIKDRYQTTALMGEGAFGRTFAARDTATGADVVLKQIRVRGLPGWKPVEYFDREVAVLRALDHPGVPRFVDAFETEIEGEGPAQVLVMERIVGETLLALIQRGHRWPEDRARRLLEQLLETLDHLHRLSPPVIHRDIKPANIMLRQSGEHAGQPVLVDFGAVHDWGSRAGHGSLTVVGTVGYMAPEQAMGAPVPASDLFALGATMVHALSHCHPADLPRRGLQLAFQDRLGCSADLVAILEQLVEPDLRQRYTRAADALTDLRRPPRALVPARDTPEPRSRTRALVPIALPPAPRPLSRVAQAQLRGRATFRAVKTLGAWATAMAAAAGFLTYTRSPGYLLVAALATIGAAGLLTFTRGNQRDLQLHRHGTAAEGRVYDVRRDVTGNTLYARVLYDFQIGDRHIRGELDAANTAARQVQVDDPVLVVYDPSNPRRHLATLVG
jgi:hypothetical protein